jgi:hypothetical protein
MQTEDQVKQMEARLRKVEEYVGLHKFKEPSSAEDLQQYIGDKLAEYVDWLRAMKSGTDLLHQCYIDIRNRNRSRNNGPAVTRQGDHEPAPKRIVTPIS